jgi:hypothetical protein
MKNFGKTLEGVFYLIILRTIRVIMSVICVLGGYQRQKLLLTILFLEAEHRIYGMYSPTFPRAVAHAIRPKGRKLSTIYRKNQ